MLRDRQDLVHRIDRRVEAMFHQGLVTETEGLLKLGLANNPTALQALGYRQVVEMLKGARALEMTIDLVRIRTRQFAKRQMTWFSRQIPAEWIRVEPLDSVESTTSHVMTCWERHQASAN
jgi:tRNA dimethylallyltransferase